MFCIDLENGAFPGTCQVFLEGWGACPARLLTGHWRNDWLCRSIFIVCMCVCMSLGKRKEGGGKGFQPSLKISTLKDPKPVPSVCFSASPVDDTFPLFLASTIITLLFCSSVSQPSLVCWGEAGSPAGVLFNQFRSRFTFKVSRGSCWMDTVVL